MLALVSAQVDDCSVASTIAITAAVASSASPASVKTERLCDASDEQSSTRDVRHCCDGGHDSLDDVSRRPSLMLGTHSMIGMCTNGRPLNSRAVVSSNNV